MKVLITLSERLVITTGTFANNKATCNTIHKINHNFHKRITSFNVWYNNYICISATGFEIPFIKLLL